MTQLQKIIKYGAIVFGTYLSIMIIGIIILILTAIFGISTGIEEWENEIKEDIECIGKLDFAFAKAKYSRAIHGITPKINTQKQIYWVL